MLAIAAIAGSLSAQSPVSVYNFNRSLDFIVDNNTPNVKALRHRTMRQGGGGTVDFAPTTYAVATVGSVRKGVVNFAEPQLFRADHGMNANGGQYVNQYTMVFDVKFDAPTIGEFASFFNTNADSRNDGDSFVRWDDDGAGAPIGRIGIAGVYAGDIAPNAWNRIVIAVDCLTSGGATLTYWVNGVRVNQVQTSSGVDGRFAAYSWDDNDTDGDHIDILADNDGDNGTGQLSQVAFYDRVLADSEVSGLGAVGTPLSHTTATPRSYQVTRGVEVGTNDPAKLGVEDDVFAVAQQRFQFAPTLANAEITADLTLVPGTRRKLVNVALRSNALPIQDPSCRQEIVLFNWIDNRFEVVDVRKPSTAKQVVTFTIDAASAAKYVRSGDGAVRAACRVFHLSPLFAAWTMEVDSITFDYSR
jgi:hypothetical protein